MRPRRVTLLDIGLDSSFDAAMTFVQSTLQNINAGCEAPIVEIDFVRSRDPDTVLSAFTSSCDVLHVMAHGDHSVTPSFTSTDGEFTVSFEQLGEVAADRGKGISTGAIIADGCKTGTGAWQKAVRDCLQGEVTYVGTSSIIGWHESGVFSSAFYGALFRNRGRGVKPADQAQDAATRAIDAYALLTDKNCPFKVTTLKPSQRARTLLS
ncbi:hypothetical protein AWV63_06210 [Micromonospora rifamycinica]|uniref:CHAT domain-containing protein n=1 Tax=Micromonospora rifamycinica TaxID=291594 RepID=A0A120F9M4_9ACTN|nr:hypothetical protein AWV63_06210 [Micromonospora rifamycinica]SCG56990.1 hypothetical protein GA0070623_2480 [Micromonospora rifamycinica]